MTTATDRARDEQLIAAFAVVLTHGLGFSVEQPTHGAWISQKGLRFVVEHVRSETGLMAEEVFDDVRDAVSYYLDLVDEQNR